MLLQSRRFRNQKNKEDSNFLHTYCDADNTRYISDKLSVVSIVHIFNVTIVYWCSKKQSKTPINSSNAETRAIYTGLLDQNWIIDFSMRIGYPIGTSSKLYEDNQATIKIVLTDRITLQARPLNILITVLHEIHLRKNFNMVDTRSNIQLADLNSKPHEKKMIRNIIHNAIGSRFYPPPVSVH